MTVGRSLVIALFARNRRREMGRSSNNEVLRESLDFYVFFCIRIERAKKL